MTGMKHAALVLLAVLGLLGEIAVSLARDSEPEQVKATNAVELKQVGREAWRIPIGLRYQGHNPQGRNRVEHIERHTRDISNRVGPYGVIGGGRDVALTVIDEPWRFADKTKLGAVIEGGRTTYSVRMNRRVGYLGGSTGKERGHPPLDRVFIVFETDTKNIVTAFARQKKS